MKEEDFTTLMTIALTVTVTVEHDSYFEPWSNSPLYTLSLLSAYYILVIYRLPVCLNCRASSMASSMAISMARWRLFDGQLDGSMAARWLDAVRLDGSMPTEGGVSLDGWMAGSMARLDGRLDGASMAPRWRLDGSMPKSCDSTLRRHQASMARWLDGSMAPSMAPRWHLSMARWRLRSHPYCIQIV